MKRCIAFADAAAKSEVMGPTETLLFGKQLPQNCRQPQNIANDVHRFHNFAVAFRHCACRSSRRSSHRPETPRSSRRLTQPTQKANPPVRFFILSLFCFKSFAYKKKTTLSHCLYFGAGGRTCKERSDGIARAKRSVSCEAGWQTKFASRLKNGYKSC